MKANIYSYCLLIAFQIFANLAYAQQHERTKKAIIMIVDGIPADVIERVNTLNIDAISTEGGYTRAYMGGEIDGYSQTPTISAVCYTSMITGTWGNKHNVWDNDLSDPNYQYWSLFRYLKSHKPESKIGIYSTWLDNRTKLLGENLRETNHLKFDFHADGYELDTIRFPHDKQAEYINKIDEEVVLQASKSIRADAPDLSWVYLQYTDDVGHHVGDSEEMDLAVQKADRQVGDIFQAVKYREQYYLEDWMVVIITDHGRDAATGYSHGGQTPRERAIWISTNAKSLNQHFYAHQPAIVDILPSVARHLAIPIGKTQQEELDGVPFIGKVSLAHPLAKLDGTKKLSVRWTPIAHMGKVKIKAAASNDFKIHGDAKADKYVDLGDYELKDGKAAIDLPTSLQGKALLKVVIEGEHNILNYWVEK